MHTPAFSHSPGFASAVHTAPPEVSVYDAARIMQWRKVGIVVIVKDHRPLGIVTDRDLATRVVANGLDPRTTPLARVMTAPVVTIGADVSDEQVIRQLMQSQVRQLPMVDGTGHVVGLAAWVVAEDGAPARSFSAVVARSTVLVPMVKRKKFRRMLYGMKQEVTLHLRWVGAAVALAAIGAVMTLILAGHWNPWSPVPKTVLHSTNSSRVQSPISGARAPEQPDPNRPSVTSAR
ncbi:MAG: CBS domain-containing protein [Nitrospira sp.]